MTVGRFLCLCPPKGIELGDASRASRPENRVRIRAALEAVDFGGREKTVICLPGGGVAVEGTGSCPEVACVGPLLAVLSGTVQNYAYLVRKYFLAELGIPRNVSLEDLRQTTPMRDAALLCRLYGLLGTGMLAKLRGKFGFCIYDSSTVRVLAARDASGSVSLAQGTTAGGDLFVASGHVRPPCMATYAEIQPGMYKYGWHAAPRKFANRQDVVEGRAAAASSAAQAALSGLVAKGQKSSDLYSASPIGARPGSDGTESRSGSSTSSTTLAIPKFRTKAEMREWSAGAAREAIESYEAGAGMAGWGAPAWRRSPAMSPAVQRCSLGTRADVEDVWRLPRVMLDRRSSSSTLSSAESCMTGMGSGGQSPMRCSPDSWGKSEGRSSGSSPRRSLGGFLVGRWETTGLAGFGVNAATWRK